MELELKDILYSLSTSIERLSCAASALEVSAARLEEREAVISGDVSKITAAVESNVDMTRKDLEAKLIAAEQKIAELLSSQDVQANSLRAAAVRKTLPAPTLQLLAKQGLESFDTIDSSTIDSALTGLSVEQRIAVKAQLLRAGAIQL